MVSMVSVSTRSIAAAFSIYFGLVPQLAKAAEEPAQAPSASSQTESGRAEGPASTVDVKKLFASQCAWCHADYGMKAGKGPRLAGTQMTEKQVHDRILNGKTDAMPPFKRVLTEEQITAFAQYIKSLKPED
jgi:mono/diheme cytochrome c family protein